MAIEVVAQGVLDQRLQQQRRTFDFVQQLAVAVDAHLQAVAVAQALQVEVVAHELQLGGDGGPLRTLADSA
jgi:hypothetical protein